ncbi:hypothetical protein D915_003660 [Fasciola hepatica]|uniref:Uncharacterized protein n=1 Tax=Fasciola hepatica TaxID=6192 RepID=A0A4E0RVU1_FASHE|nr:hypothetical protein D915_003660 [Fasciola hepatica]
MHMYIFILLVLPDLVWMHQSPFSCPSGFNIIENATCVLLVEQKVGFCGAHQYCESEGTSRGLRMFVPGEKMKEIESILPSESIVHTGITALLSDKRDTKIKWRSGDPGSGKRAIELPNAVKYNLTGKEAHISSRYVLGYMNDHYVVGEQYGNQSTHVVCEISNCTLSVGVESFSLNWPAEAKPTYFEDDYIAGCFKITEEDTLMKCCLK